MNDVRALDLPFLGAERVLACGVVPVEGGVALVDPGPSTVLPALEDGLGALGHGLGDVRALLLTHIHLDHAGATGTLVRRLGVPVWVHEVGARHLARPEKLIASATRLYGDRMDELWGAFEAVPEASLRPLAGGEAVEVGGRALDVAYTPGHAVHHVAYFDRATATAFVGDTVGMTAPPSERVLPVTPPPDVDLEAWPASLDRIAAWEPERLFRMHWGASETPAADLAAFRTALDAWAARVRADRADADADRGHQAAAFSSEILSGLDADLGAEAAAPYRALLYPDASWHGLARALR
ncbi:MBL fold metallo-hydrolase [Rubrivirga litoralis]|uniref:MBL fold metallo-hydrolase n=1 Tax=Rubrivirga litoralis TaxID=3075598 RepID=A0ABU3BRS9_9BACT|nr:MBL fold metallo-hydrolase [Rubrivirga sp. F394]MDT0631996.1 MBL fold metallo-hydrolase [Rubrivirga sp. F394]